MTTADQLIEQGLTASRSGRGDQALALFEQAAALAPSSGIAHFLIGAELAQNGKVTEAEEAYANAVTLMPALHMARFQLGLLQFTSRRAATALVTWGPLLSVPRESPLPWIVEGFTALAHDDQAAAARLFQEAIVRNHDNASLSKDLELLLTRLAPAAQLNRNADGKTQPTTVTLNEPEIESEPEGLHVLLANYQQGPLH